MADSGNYAYKVSLSVEESLAALQSMMKDMQGVVSKVVDLQESMNNAANKGGKRLQDTFSKIGESAFTFVNVKDTIDRLSGALDDMAAPGLRLNEAMHSLSAVSGVTGKGLKQIEGYARKAAKTFGGSASDSVNAYQLVLSQLGPHIAQVPEALAAMGDSIKTTSKLMGNDTTAAAEVLTTALNQYQVSLDDPIKASEEMARMMNVMAAAGQAGSAELPTIGEALKQSGMMAKAAGVSFEELNASIQILDKAGKKGSEGGVALRNVMGTLAKGRFLPKDVKEELGMAGVSIDKLTNKSLSMTDRLRALAPVMNDSALLSKLFGQANASAAVALIASLDPIDELTAAISGSNSAYEQAAIIMESDIEKMSRFQAKIDDIKIRLYGLYSGTLPYIKGLGSAMQMTANIAITANAMHMLSETSLALSIKRRTIEMLKSKNTTIAATAKLGFYNTAVVLARRFTSLLTKELKKQRFAAIKAQLATMGAGASFGFFAKMAVVGRMACSMLVGGIKAISTAIYNIPIFGWIVAGIALVIKGIQLLWNKSEGFRRVVFGVWEVVKGIFSAAREYISGFVDCIREKFAGIRDKITGFFTGIRDKISGLFSGIGDKFTEIIAPVKRGLDHLKTMFSDFAQKVKEKLDPIFEPFRKFGGWIKGLFNAGAEKGSESWAKDHPKQQTKAADHAGIDVQSLSEPSAMQTAMAAGAAAQSGFSTGKIDLNNVKGSTNYAAVVAKLQPKTFAGLGGGAGKAGTAPLPGMAAEASPVVPELPSFLEQPEDKTLSILQRIAADTRKMAATMTIAASTVLPVAAQSGANIEAVRPVAAPIAASTIMPVAAQWDANIEAIRPAVAPIAAIDRPAAREGKTVNFAKFCDKVEINVPSGTTREQVDTILNELMRRINDAVD